MIWIHIRRFLLVWLGLFVILSGVSIWLHRDIIQTDFSLAYASCMVGLQTIGAQLLIIGIIVFGIGLLLRAAFR